MTAGKTASSVTSDSRGRAECHSDVHRGELGVLKGGGGSRSSSESQRSENCSGGGSVSMPRGHWADGLLAGVTELGDDYIVVRSLREIILNCRDTYSRL